VRNHLRLVEAPKMRLSTLKRMFADDGFDELLHLARLDAVAASGNLEFVLYFEQRRAELAAEVKPPRLLSSDDVIAMGFTPGPRIGDILQALETATLEGEIVARDDAERWARLRLPS
jgi:hypothetical protein